MVIAKNYFQSFFKEEEECQAFQYFFSSIFKHMMINLNSLFWVHSLSL